MRPGWLVPIVLAASMAGCTTDPADVTVSSPTVQAGEPIPRQHTCDGREVSPQLNVGGLPEGTRTVALIVDDPDAPGDAPFVHWLVWNVPVSSGTAHLPEGSIPDGAREGTNSAGSEGYAGPCPPRSDGPHTYRFTAYGVDRQLALEQGASRDELESALEGHVIASGRLPAHYDR